MNPFHHIALSLAVVVFCVGVSGQAQGITDGATYLLDIAWSPDGTMVAISRGQGSCNPNALDTFVIELVSVTANQETRHLRGHTCPPNSLAWSPDGTTIVSSAVANGAFTWNVETGEIVSRNPFSTGRTSLVWSPDGTKVAAGRGTLVEIWDPITSGRLMLLEGHTDSVLAVAWNLDGTSIASGSVDNTVRIWDTSTGQALQILQDPISAVTSVAWSPDGSSLAAGDGNGTIHIWNPSTGQITSTLRSASEPVNAVAWNPDGTQLASSSAGGIIYIWAVELEQVLETFQSTSYLPTIAYSPYGGQLAYGGIPSGSLAGNQIEMGSNVRTLANGAVQIVVPSPSLERLQAIAGACDAPEALTASIEASDLGSFIAAVEALPENTIPPACAADLVAVAEALQHQTP